MAQADCSSRFALLHGANLPAQHSAPPENSYAPGLGSASSRRQFVPCLVSGAAQAPPGWAAALQWLLDIVKHQSSIATTWLVTIRRTQNLARETQGAAHCSQGSRLAPHSFPEAL